MGPVRVPSRSVLAASPPTTDRLPRPPWDEGRHRRTPWQSVDRQCQRGWDRPSPDRLPCQWRPVGNTLHDDGCHRPGAD